MNIKYSLLNKLKEYNIVYDYIEFPPSRHGLLHDSDKSVEFYKCADEYIAKYFDNH